ncbi:MAG TPA: HXXEE domain-containing protein [Ignavibacteria bacterium]|nr:HXXEE domain-containing protein [Ignavibacteria bacterium]
MNFLRNHWFDIGGILAILNIIALLIFHTQLTSFEILLWISLISLFVHQVEEYRYPGYFPGMVNTVLFKSTQPERYPLNTSSAFIINVILGWGVYAAAIFVNNNAIWFTMIPIIVSLGNFMAHTTLFNIKGKTFYNPGMLTSIFLFLPIVIYYFYYVSSSNLAETSDYIIGIILGIILNYVGIIKVINWMKNKNTPYVFQPRQAKP